MTEARKTVRTAVGLSGSLTAKGDIVSVLT